MRYYPVDEYDYKDLEKLNAKDWMVEALKKNPRYTSWGNKDDYMDGNGEDKWESPITVKSIYDLPELDENNEVINFYFKITRKNHECDVCNGTGYNKETNELNETWNSFNNVDKGWQYNLTQDEVDLLWDKKRLDLFFKHKPTAQEVNKLAKTTSVHDFLNKIICVEARAKRLGVYGYCSECTDGYVYDEPNAKLGLQLWVIHPVNGASQGVYLEDIKENELEDVIKYLKEADKRLSDKFSKLDNETSSNWIENLLNKNNNPVISWGNGCEYMLYELSGWNEPVVLKGVDELWELDDYNELVNFYFEHDNEDYGAELQMWIIHPRKGASRGVVLRHIKEEDVNTIIDYLKKAKERNTMRFEKL